MGIARVGVIPTGSVMCERRVVVKDGNCSVVSYFRL